MTIRSKVPNKAFRENYDRIFIRGQVDVEEIVEASEGPPRDGVGKEVGDAEDTVGKRRPTSGDFCR